MNATDSELPPSLVPISNLHIFPLIKTFCSTYTATSIQAYFFKEKNGLQKWGGKCFTSYSQGKWLFVVSTTKPYIRLFSLIMKDKSLPIEEKKNQVPGLKCNNNRFALWVREKKRISHFNEVQADIKNQPGYECSEGRKIKSLFLNPFSHDFLASIYQRSCNCEGWLGLHSSCQLEREEKHPKLGKTQYFC